MPGQMSRGAVVSALTKGWDPRVIPGSPGQADESLADFENTSKKVMSNSEWQAWYQKVQGVIESGHREILNVVAEQ